MMMMDRTSKLCEILNCFFFFFLIFTCVPSTFRLKRVACLKRGFTVHAAHQKISKSSKRSFYGGKAFRHLETLMCTSFAAALKISCSIYVNHWFRKIYGLNSQTPLKILMINKPCVIYTLPSINCRKPIVILWHS